MLYKNLSFLLFTRWGECLYPEGGSAETNDYTAKRENRELPGTNEPSDGKHLYSLGRVVKCS